MIAFQCKILFVTIMHSTMNQKSKYDNITTTNVTTVSINKNDFLNNNNAQTDNTMQKLMPNNFAYIKNSQNNEYLSTSLNHQISTIRIFFAFHTTYNYI